MADKPETIVFKEGGLLYHWDANGRPCPLVVTDNEKGKKGIVWSRAKSFIQQINFRPFVVACLMKEAPHHSEVVWSDRASGS